jgi:hypothetical protein
MGRYDSIITGGKKYAMNRKLKLARYSIIYGGITKTS